ncbi:hypothetical protein V6N11_061782 [Hibiscus sabdariffa]
MPSNGNLHPHDDVVSLLSSSSLLVLIVLSVAYPHYLIKAWMVDIILIRREANRATNFMEKLNAPDDRSLVLLESAPLGLLSLLYHDINSLHMSLCVQNTQIRKNSKNKSKLNLN